MSQGAIVDQIRVLARPEFWSATETRDKLRSLVPEYRLSKFQRALPDRWQSELVGAYLLDFDGAGRVANALSGAARTR